MGFMRKNSSREALLIVGERVGPRDGRMYADTEERNSTLEYM